jgi:hypothetical protein
VRRSRPWRAVRPATATKSRRTVAADGGGAGPGVAAAGEGAGGAHDVVRDGGDGQPGGVGAELAGRQVRQRAVVQVGEELLDDGVAAVLLLGLDQLVRAVGETAW